MDVEKYYKNAFLRMPEDPKEKQAEIDNFERLVKMADKMMEVDTQDVPYFEITSQIQSPLREDVVEESIDREEAFKNTQHREYGYFKLDNIMED